MLKIASLNTERKVNFSSISGLLRVLLLNINVGSEVQLLQLFANGIIMNIKLHMNLPSRHNYTSSLELDGT